MGYEAVQLYLWKFCDQILGLQDDQYQKIIFKASISHINQRYRYILRTLDHLTMILVSHKATLSISFVAHLIKS